MPFDLDPDDVAEVRRRVVDPVVKSLVAPEELEEVSIAGGGSVSFLVKVRARGEWIACQFSTRMVVGETELCDAEEVADEFYEALRDELVESKLSWGQWRDGDYQVLGPRQN